MARSWNPAYHPRDKKGRFTRSATRSMSAADKKRGKKALESFNVRAFSDAGEARAYLEDLNPDTAPAVKKYLDSDWRDVNTALRAGKPADGVDEIDAAMQPLPADLLLRRQVPLSLFAHVPMKDLEGMKVRDAAYASTSLDVGHTPGGKDVVTMHIAAPAGTNAHVNSADGEILLARDTEVAITRVESDGNGGWDVYGAVLPKAKPRKAAPGGDTSAPGEPSVTPAEPTSAPRPTGTAAHVDDRIPAVIGDILARDAAQPGTLVSLARVRDQLNDLNRSDVDAALLRLDRARVIQLEPDPDRRNLTARAKAAAIPLGGDDMHLVALVKPVDEPSSTAAAPGRGALDAAPIDVMASPRPAALSHRMYRALRGYQDDNFTAVNSQLRGGGDTLAVSRQVAAMDEAMQVSKLTRDVQVFRGLADARSMFGDRVNGDLTGLSWREDAFMSTSAESKVARRFAEDGLSDGTPMVIRVTVPQGTSAMVLSNLESELLVDRGHTLTVTRDGGLVDGMRVIDVAVEPKPADGS